MSPKVERARRACCACISPADAERYFDPPGERVAQEAGLPKDSYRVEECNLADLSSVKAFAETMAKEGLDVLVCNGAVYFPQATEPTFTKDGFEESVGVNHIAHFYLVEKLLGTLQKSDVGR
eukprot:scaffold21_cov368-Prasinococcus_capsulatus_cf.AAC.3